MDALPYTFDLLWDIKSKPQLVQEYLIAKEKVEGIEEACADHNIDLPSLISILSR